MRSRTRMVALGALLVLLGTSVWVATQLAYVFDPQEYASEGAVLVAALERYYTDRHNYPDKLDDLVPSYMGRLGRTPRAKWSYAVFSHKQGFELEYHVSSVTGVYRSDTAKWYVHEDSL